MRHCLASDASGAQRDAPESIRVRVRYAGAAPAQPGDPVAQSTPPPLDSSGAIPRTLVWEDKELGARVWVR